MNDSDRKPLIIDPNSSEALEDLRLEKQAAFAPGDVEKTLAAQMLQMRRMCRTMSAMLSIIESNTERINMLMDDTYKAFGAIGYDMDFLTDDNILMDEKEETR